MTILKRSYTQTCCCVYDYVKISVLLRLEQKELQRNTPAVPFAVIVLQILSAIFVICR